MGTTAETVKTVEANGLRLAYETIGDPSGTPLLLIMGLGSQMLSWPDEFCQLFVDRGYQVVRYDNRDIGLSTHFTEAGMPDLMARLGGTEVPTPYLVDDMADDAAALLDALDLSPAHIVGVSMGGMIAQALAIRHPDHVRSLTSIMSTPNPNISPPDPIAISELMRPPATTRDEYIENSVKTFSVIGSPAYPMNEAWQREKAGESWDRDPDPAGRARQLLAILSSPDRAPGLAGVTVPTLVIHGSADPLVTPSGAQATADAIPGAELVVLEGMGHDLPEPLWGDIVGHIDTLAKRADGR
jgi:pimeloyl-ACP methyl ester carboxylesterase